MMENSRDVVEAYGKALEQLSPETIDALTGRCAPDVHFLDPFNEVRGREAMGRVFGDMFDKLDEVSFEVREITGADHVWCLRFTFTAKGKAIGEVKLDGVSWLRLTEDGLVAEHLDYWDGGVFYEHMPGLGMAVRAVKRRIAA